MPVRFANPSDAPALIRLNAEFNGPGMEDAAHVERSLRENPQEIVCVAELDGEVVGFCCAQIVSSFCYAEKAGEITELYVQQSARRKGLAAALLRLAERELVSRGATELKLLTGRDNLAAQALYESLGYERDEEVHYAKEVSPASHAPTLRLVKPDLYFFDQYNDMMSEWLDSGTRIAPWFLDEPLETIDEFAKLIQRLDDCEHGLLDKRFSSTTSYFVINSEGRLIGAASLRHHLTVEGFITWGHIGYGVRPSERRKGCATEILRLMLEEAKRRKLCRVLIGAYSDNIGSCRTIEKCGGALENAVPDPEHPEKTINRYWIEV